MAFLKRIFFLLLVVVWPLAGSQAVMLELREQEIKAGLLYNFLKYTEWPENEGSSNPMTVCVLGGNSFKSHLDPMAGRTVHQRDIQVRSVDMTTAAGCHLLFLGQADKNSWPSIKMVISGKPVLTVGDFPGFTSAGGMIEFGRKSDRVHVSLNSDAVTAASLRVQNRLLNLVTVVSAKEGGVP